MLSKKEKLFVEYWERARERERRLGYQLLMGLPVGLLFAIPIMVIVFTGKYWYKRADMAATGHLSATLLGIIVFCIATFVAIFYKRHQWDMKEQQYMELKSRQRKEAEDEG